MYKSDFEVFIKLKNILVSRQYFTSHSKFTQPSCSEKELLNIAAVDDRDIVEYFEFINSNSTIIV